MCHFLVCQVLARLPKSLLQTLVMEPAPQIGKPGLDSHDLGLPALTPVNEDTLAQVLHYEHFYRPLHQVLGTMRDKVPDISRNIYEHVFSTWLVSVMTISSVISNLWYNYQHQSSTFSKSGFSHYMLTLPVSTHASISGCAVKPWHWQRWWSFPHRASFLPSSSALAHWSLIRWC